MPSATSRKPTGSCHKSTRARNQELGGNTNQGARVRKRPRSPLEENAPTQRNVREKKTPAAHQKAALPLRPPPLLELSDSSADERSVQGNGNDSDQDEGEDPFHDDDEDLDSLAPAQAASQLGSETVQVPRLSKGNQPEDQKPLVDPHTADVNASWPVEAHYTLPKPGSRLIGVYAQPQPLRNVLKQGKILAMRFYLQQGFFIVNDNDFTVLTSILTDVARQSSLDQIVLRLQKDHTFTMYAVRLMSHRLAMSRSKAKTIAVPLVGISYGFQNPAMTVSNIKSLANALLRNSAYIFPQENGNPIKTRPYEHPSIIQTLAKFLFNVSSRGTSLGDQHPDIFASTFPRYPDQREIPASVLALVATAIHFSIVDWTTGSHVQSDFVVDVAEDVFNGHKNWLVSIKDKAPSKFHVMMHRIYKQCSNNVTTGAGIMEGIGEVVDVDGMEDIPTDTEIASSTHSDSTLINPDVSQEL